MSTAPPATGTSDLAVFARIIAAQNGDLPPDLARYLLSLDFPEDDKERMRALAERNQAGDLSPVERDELGGYVKAGHLLALLQSKARKSLKRKLRRGPRG